MVVMNMTVGQNLKSIRTAKGLTQAKLSELTGIAEVTIRKYESGKIVPKSQNLNRLAKGLGVSPSDIDEGLLELFQRWDSQTDTGQLSKEVQVCESITETFGEYKATFFQNFLSLNPEGQKQASEYMDFLMQKYEK